MDYGRDLVAIGTDVALAEIGGPIGAAVSFWTGPKIAKTEHGKYATYTVSMLFLFDKLLGMFGVGPKVTN